MSSTYIPLRKIFYLDPEKKDVVRVVAREKTLDGNVIVKTIYRPDNIQFPVPASALEQYFVAVNDDLFPDNKFEARP